MPEDLEDKLDDFELMLEGFVSKCGVADDDRGATRLLCYWYALKSQIEKINYEQGTEKK